MTYTRTNLKNQIFDSTSQANIGSAITLQDLLNRVVRRVYADVDLRTAKRKTQISPGLFRDVFTYPWPTDAKGLGLIDVDPQVNRSSDSELYLTTPEEFQRRKSLESNLAAIRENDFVKKLLLNIPVDDNSLVISSLDSLTAGGGEWLVSPGAINLSVDASNKVNGAASLKWDMNGSSVFSYLFNSTLNEIDLSDYLNSGSFFIWFYLPALNVTDCTLQWGDNSASWLQTVTTTHEGTAFQLGWNLLRFDWAGATEFGSPTVTNAQAVTYFEFDFTQSSATATTDYRLDSIFISTGVFHDLYYYTKYGWQSNTGTYKENSTADTDFVNADTDELELFTYAGKAEAALELRHFNLAETWEKRYQDKKAEYQLKYPSESKLLTQVIYET